MSDQLSYLPNVWHLSWPAEDFRRLAIHSVLGYTLDNASYEVAQLGKHLRVQSNRAPSNQNCVVLHGGEVRLGRQAAVYG